MDHLSWWFPDRYLAILYVVLMLSLLAATSASCRFASTHILLCLHLLEILGVFLHFMDFLLPHFIWVPRPLLWPLLLLHWSHQWPTLRHGREKSWSANDVFDVCSFLPNISTFAFHLSRSHDWPTKRLRTINDSKLYINCLYPRTIQIFVSHSQRSLMIIVL